MATPTTYKTRIVLRTDTTLNWEKNNPTLKIGEMGYAIDAGAVTCGKVGLGLTWNATPIHFSPFKPIVTNYGRDLNHAGGPYDAQHNFQNETDAWEYVLNPYSPPAIGFNPSIITDLEVGTPYTALNARLWFNVYNTPSLFLENVAGVDQKVYYVNSDPITIAGGTGTKYLLTDQLNNTVSQAHYFNLSAASNNNSGIVNVATVSVRGKKNPSNTNSVYTATAGVRFRWRSAAFIWNTADEIFYYTDAQLSSMLRGLGADFNGGRYTTMADGGGNKAFGTVTWDTIAYKAAYPTHPANVNGAGKYNICIIAPASAGKPVITNPAAPQSPQTLQERDFRYLNGSGDNAYKLYMTLPADSIIGKYTTDIK